MVVHSSQSRYAVPHLDSTIKSSNLCVEGSCRIHSFHSFLIKWLEEVADQTGLELFSMPWQLSPLSHVTSLT